jgi:signal transduction histidine kinase
LAYKEILRNIIRHAKATNVAIAIRFDEQGVKLSVTDNGKGFIIDHPTNRNGLMNIRQRSGRWKGRAQWMSNPGEGTSVTVFMKPG